MAEVLQINFKSAAMNGHQEHLLNITHEKKVLLFPGALGQ